MSITPVKAGGHRFPNGGYLVRYRDDRNATLRKTFATKKEAVDFEAKVRTDIREGRFTNAKLASTPFRLVAEDWFEAMSAKRRPKTVAGYRSILDVHLLPAFGHRPIGRVKANEIEKVLADVKPGTQRNVLNVLSPIFKQAIKAGMIQTNPCSLVDLPTIQRKEMLFLTPEQVGQLADEITPHYRTLILTAAYTGMRAGELAALRVKNVDPLRARISVKESVADVGGRLHYGQPKTAKGNREIGVPRFLVDLLTVQMASKSGDDLLFTGPNGAPLRHSNYYQRHFRPTVMKLVADGVWPAELTSLRFHDLRHTCASILIDQGVHPKLIADRLGHASIAITMDRYGHRFADKEDAIAATLDDVFANRKLEGDTGGSVTELQRG